ncbi:MAG: hypothetical protein DMG80_09885 [Acidobacteria bacterium]|nr:MAG: hypothetical protein DMG80_09885 [Acidobacteriota bacterium]
MQKGSTAFLTPKDKDGAVIVNQEPMRDENNDGRVQFGVVDQEKVGRIIVTKVNDDGRQISYDGMFDKSSSLPSFEPFDLVTFAGVDPARSLFTILDAGPFLAEVRRSGSVRS